jgi:peroxiredoxin Q/BCP
MPNIGDIAPDFTLSATGGKTVSLSDYKGKSAVVLYWYPKDMTPGCTTEACSFRDLEQEFKDAGAVILGVSMDSIKSHENFATKHSLPFTLLSDEDKTVSTAYDVFKEKSMYGKTFLGIVRTTFVIDKEGIIRKVWPKVKVEGHVDEVLEFIKQL